MKWVILGLTIAVLVGCTTHYYTKQGDLVSIILKKNAQEVYFASSLDQFTLHAAQKNADGLWKIQVPGNSTFRYFYWVDGAEYLPDCRFKELDDFGKQNCIFMPHISTDISNPRLTVN